MTEEQKKAVLERVNLRWADNKQPTLLSDIGILLSKTGERKSRRRGGTPLRAILEAEIGDQIKVLQNPSDPAMHVVIPRDATLEPGGQLLLSRRSQREGDTPARFRAAVWAAFVKPVPPGHQRYLHLNPVLRFDDVQAGSAKPAGAHLIPAERIGRQDAGEPDAQKVDEIIRGWAEAEGIGLPALLQGGESTSIPAGDTVLHLVLETLPQREHHRLTLPLDLVRLLLSRRVK